MNILFCATYGDFLATFEFDNICRFLELGCNVHCASNFEDHRYNRYTDRLDEVGVIRHEIHFSRNPLDANNIKSYRKINRLIEREQIGCLDIHNAVVGVYSRIAGAKHGTINIYTPHSFFFYKGAPLINHILFKPIEALLAKKTDLLIAINKEDYEYSKHMRLRGKSIYVPGVGLDLEKIYDYEFDNRKYMEEFNVRDDRSIVFLSVGELNRNKNHCNAINAFAKANIENSIYIICGIGERKEELQELIEKKGLVGKVILLGYRNDVWGLMKWSDVFVFPSFREGLSVSLMEAMACGMTCVVSDIRGNVDLIDDGKGGYLYSPYDVDEIATCMRRTVDEGFRETARKYNMNRIKLFDKSAVDNIMREEYRNILNRV